MGNNRLKIAMVLASPFPANHGTPGSTGELMEAVAQRGHDVHVVTYHFGEGANPEGVHIHRIPDLGLSRRVVVGPTLERPFLDFQMVFTLCQVIRRENIDLIHAHNYEGALVGYLARVITGRPVVYNAINMMSDELPTYSFFKPRVLGVLLGEALDYWVPRMADRIVAITPEIAGALHSRGIRSNLLRMIPLGINTDQFAGRDSAVIRERYSLVGNPLVIYTGILDRLQRTDYLLRAMGRVVAEFPESRLLLVATIFKDDDLRECRKLISELELEEHVIIAAGTAFEEIPFFLASADVAVVCRPRCPGFPVKLLNYMAAGKSIVAFEGSAKGLQHMTNAFVVSDHDWQGLADGVICLLRDRNLAAKLGDNARQWVRANHAWPKISEEIEGVYNELFDLQTSRERKH